MFGSRALLTGSSKGSKTLASSLSGRSSSCERKPIGLDLRVSVKIPI